MWLISLLTAAGASEQEIRLTRGLEHTTTETRRPPAPPAGPAALLPFRGRCVSTKLGADDLRVCPFANATQTSLAGAEFVLGVFSTFRGRSLVYADGDVCGDAPQPYEVPETGAAQRWIPRRAPGAHGFERRLGRPRAASSRAP